MTLTGAACKDMFRQIHKDRNGPVIWAYLKPMLRGKIVYAPKTPVTNAIIGQVC